MAQINSTQDEKEKWRILAKDLGVKEFQNISNLHDVKKEIGKIKCLNRIPSNSELLDILSTNKRKQHLQLLKIKPTKSASGITVISVMTKPYNCPHGVCIFCPGGEQIGTPQSYMPTEPATMRALEAEYDPQKQIESRLTQLDKIGHYVDKVELLIIGGTFMNLPFEYQQEFIKSCYDTLNGKISKNINHAKMLAEKSRIRNVGLSVETKPDWCKQKHIDLALDFGVTRIEIGIKTLSDEIYKKTNRGHTLLDVEESLQISKDACYKIVAHMMPGLPGSNLQKDFDDFITLFNDQKYKPDMLKIYPTLVVPDTGLYKMYKEGKFEPYTTEEVVDLLARVKKEVPPWVRIMRIQREISEEYIEAGTGKGNIRELIIERMKQRGDKCECIRCREIGLKQLKEKLEINKYDIEIKNTNYESSGGEEYFISAEEKNTKSLIGFVRMRIPSNKAHRREIVGNTAIIRELHVYGQVVPIGERDAKSWQHKGTGTKLMQEAERLAKEELSIRKLLVISAVGTREYYKRLGYELEGPYMTKIL